MDSSFLADATLLSVIAIRHLTFSTAFAAEQTGSFQTGAGSLDHKLALHLGKTSHHMKEKSARMVKKQQMAWTERGAHLLLQVRTRVLNGKLEETFRRWYPKFRPEVPAVLKAVA